MAKKRARRPSVTPNGEPARPTGTRKAGAKQKVRSTTDTPVRRTREGGPLADLCRSLPGTTEDVKWGDNLVFSVGVCGKGGKMYAAFEVGNPNEVGFKCDDADFARLTGVSRPRSGVEADGAGVEGVIPAPYAARFGWVKVLERRGRPALSSAELERLLRKSHSLVLAGLPARTRAALGG